MSKVMKRLLSANEQISVVKCPVNDIEVNERNLDYPKLSVKQFAYKYRNHWNTPVFFTYSGKNYSIQYNHCLNPFCYWFGQPQARFESMPHKPYRYKLSGRSNGKGKDKEDYLACNPAPDSGYIGVDHAGLVSNWSVAEEISRLIRVNSVSDFTRHYSFHYAECTQTSANPFEHPKLFYRRGTSSSNSPIVQCKGCGKYTNILPEQRDSFNYHQKRNDVLPVFAKLLINRTPVRRTCEILSISPDTYYRKLEWLYRKCLEFLALREQKGFSALQIPKIWLNTDQFQYFLNNVRKKGSGGINYEGLEEPRLQTFVFVTADMATRYVMRADIAYDWDFTLENLEKDTICYKEDHLHEYARKNARLRISVYPQKPHITESPEEDAEYEEAMAAIQLRKQYADGFHVGSTYTALAHFWLIRNMIGAKEWRFVTDNDSVLTNSIYRVFSKEILDGYAHHFLHLIDRAKDLKTAFSEMMHGMRELKQWGRLNGYDDQHIPEIARTRLITTLRAKPFFRFETIGRRKYLVGTNGPIPHTIPHIDTGITYVDCTTDASSYDIQHLANSLLKVSSHATDAFMQQIRRRISILERPLVTARQAGGSYIYANFNPKYAQYALTILRTYYNFCIPYKTKDDATATPAQRIGIASKKYEWKDIIYFS